MSIYTSKIRSRGKEKFHVNMANTETERYKHSAKPFLQMKLNENLKVEKKQLAALLRVICVSNVDSITYRK